MFKTKTSRNIRTDIIIITVGDTQSLSPLKRVTKLTKSRDREQTSNLIFKVYNIQLFYKKIGLYKISIDHS